MESGNLPLEDALARYQRGVGLLRHCQTTLGDAEQRVRMLEGDGLTDFPDRTDPRRRRGRRMNADSKLPPSPNGRRRSSSAPRSRSPACCPMPRSPSACIEAMRYAVLGGGKRVRPLLAHAAGALAGAAERTSTASPARSS